MKTFKITVRRTRESDLVDCFKTIATSMGHLRKRAGLGPIKFKITGADPYMVHFRNTDPEGTWVALDTKGKIVAYTQSLIRGNEWYLAYLFVDPQFQSSGVGQKLLKLAMDYGRKNGEITRWALATFAYNPQAVAVYSKMGMTPQSPILYMERMIDGKKKPSLLKPAKKLEIEIVTSHRIINRLNKIDLKVRGTARPEEHFFFTGTENHKVLVFHENKKIVGYSILTASARVGPVAAIKPEYLQSLLAYSVNYGIEIGQQRQVVFANGENVAVVQALLKAGFRIEECELVMASERFSDPGRYVPGHLAHF